jgi:Flp pilus assembly protein protease CpaA
VAVCAVAVYTDLRRRLIYNWLTLPATLVGVVLGFVIDGVPGGLNAIGGAVVAAILFGVFGLLGWMKFGDVKLMIAVGAFTRFPLVLWAIAYTAIVGGLIGVGYAVYRRRFGEVVGNLGRAAVNKLRRGDQPALRDLSQLTLPYGVAIAIGAVWAILTRYVPAIRLG